VQSLRALIGERIRAGGPISVAEYMRLALYHPTLGYYARTARRTGRAGDFFTSVDVGPVFGELLASQFAEMWQILESLEPDAGADSPNPDSRTLNPARQFDLVEAAAGDGQLARDVLDAAAARHPQFYERIRLSLVEVGAAARAGQPATLGPHAARIAASTPSLPDSVRGVIFANELLDALPVHTVVMRAKGLREIYLDAPDPGGDGPLVQREGPPSTPELARYLERAGARLEAGGRADISLEAPVWIAAAARALDRGFLLLVDYGYEAAELFSATHGAGTLTTFQRHTSGDRASALHDPGERDITAHVDLTTVTRAAEASGLTTLGRLDQTYFLLGLGLADVLDASQTPDGAFDATALRRRLAFKTLLLPGGLGSTLKVLVFGKRVGTPALKGLSYGTRLT
jgi:SAM-dependent MidA family methyltransferase